MLQSPDANHHQILAPRSQRAGPSRARLACKVGEFDAGVRDRLERAEAVH